MAWAASRFRERAKQGIRAFRGPACPLLKVTGSWDLSLARSGTCLFIQPARDVDEARYQGLSRPGLSLFGGVAAYGTCPCSTLAFFWQLTLCIGIAYVFIGGGRGSNISVTHRPARLGALDLQS